MDEASQVDIATGALALSCARNVVIVGDTKQLPNVVTGDIKAKAKVIFDSFSFGSGTGSAGGNLFRFLCTGSGCSNFQKADRICEKKRKLVLLR